MAQPVTKLIVETLSKIARLKTSQLCTYKPAEVGSNATIREVLCGMVEAGHEVDSRYEEDARSEGMAVPNA